MISIVTPIKNAAEYFPACHLSVKNQSYQHWEWIIVNDNSTDESIALIAKAAQDDKRIRVFENSGKGILPALQLASKKARGEFITRMDADDEMPTNRLGNMLVELEKSPEKTVVTGKVKYIARKPISEGYLMYQEWLNERVEKQDFWKHIYRECVVASPNWILRKSDFDVAGGFENLVYPEDYDLVFQWYKHGFKMKGLDETTLLWREHEARTSRNSENYQQPAFFDLKIKRFLELDYDAEKALVLLGNGRKAQLTKRILEKQNVPFVQMVRNKAVDGNNALMDASQLRKVKNPQVLSAVYPARAQRVKLEEWLVSHGLSLGENLWYL